MLLKGISFCRAMHDRQSPETERNLFQAIVSHNVERIGITRKFETWYAKGTLVEVGRFVSSDRALQL